MAHWKPENILGEMSLNTLLFSNDYRHLALKGILTAFLMLALGGTFALLFRTELAVPGVQFMGARVYMTLMTMHGMIMVFGFLIPLAISVCYYMMPRILGMDRLAAAGTAQWGYWVLIVAAVLLMIGRPDFTWTAYAPMSLRVGGSLVWMGYLAILLVAISEFLAGIVLIANPLVAAKNGVGWKAMPMMGWGSIIVGLLLVVSTIPLGFIGLGLLTDWLEVTAFFDPARGGSVKFFLYVFWTYGHPAVYLPTCPSFPRSPSSIPCCRVISGIRCGATGPVLSHLFFWECSRCRSGHITSSRSIRFRETMNGSSRS